MRGEAAVGRRYRVVRELGQGGMGAVHLVQDTEREERVALKRISHLSASALIRFKQEFRVVERLLHPNLVRLYELGEDEGGLYFTMQAIDGAELGAFCAGVLGDTLSDGTPLPTPRFAPSASGSKLRLSEDAPTVHAPSGISSSLPLGEGRASTTDRKSDPGFGEAEARDGLTGGRTRRAKRATTRNEVPAGGTSPVDVEAVLPRLLHALPQIVEALSFLHGHGVVHRDLKPANVLVDRGGVVKLVDFGVLASLREQVSTDRGGLVGTVGFMSPEQLRGAEPLPASDLYGLGATVFTLLAGRPVFFGTQVKQMIAHVEMEPPRLATLVPEIPPALDELVARLLARRPEDRPSLEMLASLIEEAGARRPRLARPERLEAELVGREAELRDLTAALFEGERSRPAFVVLSGPSGSGKSALASLAADAAARRGMVVLRGRGRANDRVPFNAADGAIDQLAMALFRRRRLDDALARTASVAALAFPVLGEVARPSSVPVRASAFDALVVLLEAIGGDAGVLIFVDDLQWADADSLALLAHLVEAGSGRLRLLATLRDDDLAFADSTRLLEGARAPRIFPVGPLGEEALAQVVRRAAVAAGASPDDATVLVAARAAGGRPFLAEIAGRALARAGAEGDGLEDLVLRLDDEDRRLVAALLAADGWVRVRTLAEALGDRIGSLEERVRDLAEMGIVRRAGVAGAEGSVDLYHDALRVALASGLDAALVRAAHSAFADLLAASPSGEGARPRLVRHLLGAGRFVEAGGAALRAAEDAERQLAFGLAADMYAIAIEHDEGDANALEPRRALALERGTRHLEAAEVWERLAKRCDGVEAAHHRMSSAHALLAANRVIEGARRLDEALVAVGDAPVGAGGARGVGAALRFLVGPLGPVARRRSVSSPTLTRRRAECDVKTGLIVGYFDPLAGVRILQRARDSYARLGDRAELAWCDYLFACFAEQVSSSPHPPALVRRYRRAADRAAAGEPSPRLAVARTFLDANAALRAARWDAAAEGFERVVVQLDEAGLRGAFEQTFALSQIGVIAFIRHDLAALEAMLPRYRTLLDEHESAILSHERLFVGVAQVLRGELAEAARTFAELRRLLPEERLTIQRSLAAVISRFPAIYGLEGQGPRVLDRAERAALRRFRVLESNVAGTHATVLGLAEAHALARRDPAASPRRLRRYAAITRRAAPTAAGDGERALAYDADRRGRPEEALHLLARAERAATIHGRPVAAALARHQRGRRLGGDEGAALVREAESLIDERGLSRALLQEDPSAR